MDVLAYIEEGGHRVAAKKRQVAREEQAVKAEGSLDRVRVLGDELVHPDIAHELGRERNPLADPAGSNP